VISLVFLVAWLWEWHGPGLCLFHRLTGLECPGCGMTRAFHALTHGHVDEALGFNLLSLPLFIALAVVLVLDLVYIARGFRISLGVPVRAITLCEWGGVTLVMLYAVLRNVTSVA
jgi:hypothetical protein